jgi:hypothetical protein
MRAVSMGTVQALFGNIQGLTATLGELLFGRGEEEVGWARVGRGGGELAGGRTVGAGGSGSGRWRRRRRRGGSSAGALRVRGQSGRGPAGKRGRAKGGHKADKAGGGREQ